MHWLSKLKDGKYIKHRSKERAVAYRVMIHRLDCVQEAILNKYLSIGLTKGKLNTTIQIETCDCIDGLHIEEGRKI